MCINQQSLQAAKAIINRPSKDLTKAEYEILKDVNYPVKQLGYKIKENVLS